MFALWSLRLVVDFGFCVLGCVFAFVWCVGLLLGWFSFCLLFGLGFSVVLWIVVLMLCMI